MNVWELDEEAVYMIEEDLVIRGLLVQLRVPNLFDGVPADHQHVLFAFDNHPTHWIILHRWQGMPEYSPNHAVNRFVGGASPNGLLFRALPKSSTAQAEVERELKEFASGSEFLFSQFPHA